MNALRKILIGQAQAAAHRERERRRAAEQAENEAAWDEMLSRIEEMGRRLVTAPRPGNLELAKQLAQATDWALIDALRIPADLARVEAVALLWTVDPAAALRLLCKYPPGADATASAGG